MSACSLHVLATDDERTFEVNDYEGARARWCPGCGDHSVLAAVERLATELPDVNISRSSDVLPQIKGGNIKALGVSTLKRLPQLPDVPTIDEAGLKGYSSIVWNGVLVRAGTPPEIVQYLSRQIAAALESPALRKPLDDQGFDVLSSTPERFAALIRSEHAAMAPVVKTSGAKLD